MWGLGEVGGLKGVGRLGLGGGGGLLVLGGKGGLVGVEGWVDGAQSVCVCFCSCLPPDLSLAFQSPPSFNHIFSLTLYFFELFIPRQEQNLRS